MESNSSLVVNKILRQAFSDEVKSIENDSEFSAAIGIVARYLQRKDKTIIRKTPNQLNKFMIGDPVKLKKMVIDYYKKINHCLNLDDEPFKRLMSMILMYEPETVDSDCLNLGLLTKLQKNKNDRVYIRIDEEFKKKLQIAADNENRTLSNYIENVLKKEIESQD